MTEIQNSTSSRFIVSAALLGKPRCGGRFRYPEIRAQSCYRSPMNCVRCQRRADLRQLTSHLTA
jgi:hypothetical protein